MQDRIANEMGQIEVLSDVLEGEYGLGKPFLLVIQALSFGRQHSWSLRQKVCCQQGDATLELTVICILTLKLEG